MVDRQHRFLAQIRWTVELSPKMRRYGITSKWLLPTMTETSNGCLDASLLSSSPPIILINNFIPNAELDSVLYEMNALRDARLLSESISGATSVIGTPLKFAKSAWLHHLYSGIETQSAILNVIARFASTEAISDLKKLGGWYISNFIDHLILTGAVLNCYEQSNYYKAHHDWSILTGILTVYTDPELAQDYKLTFPKYSVEVSPPHNSVILFPGIVEHEAISAVKQNSPSSKVRYSVAFFLNLPPEQNARC